MSNDEREAWDEACKIYDREVEKARMAAAVYGASKWSREIWSETLSGQEDLAVSVLVDHSGSMKGQRSVVAFLAIEIISDFLTRAGCRYEILGFTTQSWKGGSARAKWINLGRRPNPGRLADLLHIVYREAIDNRPGAPYSIRHLLRSSLLKENVDGEAIVWASKRLSRLGCKNNIVIVISDGVPADDSTLASNDENILWSHLNSSVAELRSADFRFLGVGIDYDLSAIYSNSVILGGLDDIAPTIFPSLASVLRRLV